MVPDDRTGGPRFAAFCLLMAGVALPLNVITLAIAYDEIMWLPDGFEKIHTVMVKTKDRDYAAAYDVMSDEYKAKMTKDEFVAMLRPLYDGEIVIGDIGPVIGTHTGQGTIGVAFSS